MTQPDGYVDFTISGRYPVRLEHYQLDDGTAATVADALHMDEQLLNSGDMAVEELLDMADMIELELKEVVQ